MKTSITLKNTSVDFQNESIDFSCFGIYLVSGDNGVGKTSIIKQLIYGKNEIKFNTKIQEEKYRSAKHQIITYIEQDPLPDKSTVENYLFRNNKYIDLELLEELIHSLKISDADMNTKVEKLSGGELIKLNIISGLIKKTPYIFIDEPTNNLDNESVCAFIEIIKKMSVNHTFIIISHDPRCTFENANIVRIEKNKINFFINKNNKNKNIALPNNIKIPKVKLVMSHFKDSSIISSTILLSCLILINFFVSNAFISGWYNNEDLPNTKDIIATYIVDGVYGSLNQTYASGANLNIIESDYYKHITYNDIKNLADREEIEKIIISDEKYINQMSESYESEQLLDKLHIASIPYSVINEFNGIVNYDIDVRYLTAGRLPYDNKNEVALSGKVLKTFFNFNDNDIANATGKSIVINTNKYTIVGITHYDICIISFNNNSVYGFFTYNNSNYDNKISNIMNYLTSLDATNINNPRNIIIYTKKGYEKTVLDYLIKEFPANNYYSHEYAVTFSKQYNSQLSKIMITINLIFSIIIAIAFFLLFNKQMKLYRIKMKNIDNYYILNNLTNKMYLVAHLLQFAITVIGIFVITYLCSDYFSIVIKYQLLFVVFITIPILVNYLRKEVK
ncbi:ATP-binding cassette domain-containing protein [Alkalibaculum sporogenes]|nr:ATP-binding cassette domain-containing protein [Alkalibaculum sporogenes]